MKSIINGKLYDTDTATFVTTGSCHNIYITQKGNWFLVSRDGMFLKLSEEMAFDEICKICDTDALNKYFPDKKIEEA